MERDIVLKYEDIYRHITPSNKNDKNEDKINKKLLTETSSQYHKNSCFQCFSCCCFLLYT